MVKSMSSEENLSLGKMLNKARLDKNLSVNDLSFVTKIHKTLIYSLENDQIENLPNRIYVIGFLKSICEVLCCDLEKCIYLYELSLMKLSESHMPDQIVLEEVPDKIVAINIFSLKKFIKAKWLFTSMSVFIFILIISPLFVEGESRVPEKEVSTQKLDQKHAIKAKVTKKIVMARPVARISSYNVSLIASRGVSWISFQVDKNPVRKMTLKKGSSIILKGESIRLIVGNSRALDIKNNNEVVLIKKNSNTEVVKINFPQEKNNISPAQKLIYTLEHNVSDQTQRL